MLCETELKESNLKHDKNNIRTYRSHKVPITSSERKRQEKLFPKPTSKKKNINTISTESKKSETPINIHKLNRAAVYRSAVFLNNQPNTPVFSSLNDSCIDLTKLMSKNNLNNKNPVLFNHFSSKTSESSCNYLAPINTVNSTVEFNPEFPLSNKINNINSDALKYIRSDSDIVGGSTLNNQLGISTASDIPQCSFYNVYIQNPTALIHLPDFKLSNNSNENKINETQESLTIRNLSPEEINTIRETDNENSMVMPCLYEMHTGCEDYYSSKDETILRKEYDSNCPHYYYSSDDSITSEPLMGIDKYEALITQNSSFVNRNNTKIKKKIEKKNTNINKVECRNEDLCDKNDHIYPLKNMKISFSIHLELNCSDPRLPGPTIIFYLDYTMGNVQVQRPKENYRNHKKIKEYFDDNECIIEIYGFSSDLETHNLMNQFVAFNKNDFKIIWVDDTHALAVFDNPNLANRALNTHFRLMKTRALKNGIEKSKLKAKTVNFLSTARPKTCSVVAKRLVTNALGLHGRAEITLFENSQDKQTLNTNVNSFLKNNIQDSKLKAQTTTSFSTTRPKICPTEVKRLVINALGLNLHEHAKCTLPRNSKKKMFDSK